MEVFLTNYIAAGIVAAGIKSTDICEGMEECENNAQAISCVITSITLILIAWPLVMWLWCTEIN